MTKVIFENATIADSIGKAARVAPTKGEAFDKASGILMVLDPEDNTVTIKSTNLQIFYLEVVDAVEVEADKLTEWRFHASTIAQVMAKLPIGSGKQVSFADQGGEVHIKSGRMTAKFRKMDPQYYPKWEPFDPDALEVVPDLGARIQQVEWAAMDGDEAIYAGIHIDGESIVATDRIRMACVPCEAEPIYKPITIPAGILKPVLTNLRDVAIGIDEGMFLLMPDVSTQIRTRIFEKDYPPVKKGLMARTWPTSVKFSKQALLDIIERAEIFAQRDRSPKMTFIIGKGEIAVMCSDADMGLLGDAMEIDGQADHSRKKIIFTPRNLKDALNAAPSGEVEFFYDPGDSTKPIKVDGGSGYVALVMPRRESEASDTRE